VKRRGEKKKRKRGRRGMLGLLHNVKNFKILLKGEWKDDAMRGSKRAL
jgi:hypothetical protein